MLCDKCGTATVHTFSSYDSPVKVGDMVPCPMCDGRGYECVSDDGWTQVPVVCHRCEGTRVVAVEKRKDDDE